MATARIYDAEFAGGTTGTHHSHLAKFRWIDGTNATGTWTRLQAHEYVANNPGDIYVTEGTNTVIVKAYQNAEGTKWIQTEADGVKRDNLLTLARRHAQGQPNR